MHRSMKVGLRRDKDIGDPDRVITGGSSLDLVSLVWAASMNARVLLPESHVRTTSSSPASTVKYPVCTIIQHVSSFVNTNLHDERVPPHRHDVENDMIRLTFIRSCQDLLRPLV